MDKVSNSGISLLANSLFDYTHSKDLNISKLNIATLWHWKFQARFDVKLSNAFTLLYQYIEEVEKSVKINQIIDQITEKLQESMDEYSIVVSKLQLEHMSYFILCIHSNYSDKCLSKFVNIFSKHDSLYWRGNKNLMLFYQYMIEKQLVLKSMPEIVCEPQLNINMDKFIDGIDWAQQVYDRQMIEGLMLHSFRYSKHVISSKIVNPALCKLIFDKLNSEYFNPIDLDYCADLYTNAYSKIQDRFPENSQDELVYIYSEYGIEITNFEIYNYNSSPFKSTFVQEFIRACFENTINLLDPNLDRKFILGDLLIDAALCNSQDVEIAIKIQEKYDIESLIHVLSRDNLPFHFLEGVILLIRCCYLDKRNQYCNLSKPQLSKIKNGVYSHFNKITDLNNINQIRFAIESISLLINFDEKIANFDKLQSCFATIFCSLLENIQIYAKPNDFDFVKEVVFIDNDLIKYNNAIVDNEFYGRDIVLETHHKELLTIMCRFMMTNLKFEICFKSTSDVITSLNLGTNSIEKLIISIFLKYVDIPFDESFTDGLVDTLFCLQSKSENSMIFEVQSKANDQMLAQLWSKNNVHFEESDCEFLKLTRIIQNVVVSVHNFESSGQLQNFDDIKDLIFQLKMLINRFYKNFDSNNVLKETSIEFDKIDDSRTAIILGDLLYKINCNSNSHFVSQNKIINLLISKIYKALGHLVYYRHETCVRLWHYSQKLFCITWRSKKINRYHIEFFLILVSRLKAYKTTFYSINLFSKVCQKIGEFLVRELQNERFRDQSNSSLQKLLILVEDIGTRYDEKVAFNFPKTTSVFNYLNATDIDTTIYEFSHNIFSNKREDSELKIQSEDSKLEDSKEESKHSQINLSGSEKSKSLDATQNNMISESQMQNNGSQLSENSNDIFNQDFQFQGLNKFCLTLSQCKLVEVFEGILRSVPNDIDEEIRFDPRILVISNFIYKAIKYVTERDQSCQNIRQYQYLMNFLLFVVKSKELMSNYDIKRMFNSEKAIDSWFEIINKEYDFNYFSQHMKCMVYQILTEILKLDDRFTRHKIMMWTYNIDKVQRLINRIYLKIQYFTDSIIGNDKDFNLSHHEIDNLSDYLEIHFCINFLKTLCNNCKEFQDYLRYQHNRVQSTNILSSISTIIRVCLSCVKYQFCLNTCIDAFDLVYSLTNKTNQDNKDFFMSIRIFEYVKQIMEIGWFSKDRYYSIKGDQLEISDAPVFHSNKLILELKLKALEVSNQIIDISNRHEFLNLIGISILDENLKIGYAQLKYLNNGLMHSMFFDKNHQVCNNFNIKMLFECYYLKAKISDKDEIIELNVIQIYDNENILNEAGRVVMMSLFKLCKNRSSNFTIKDYKRYSRKDEFETNVQNFFEGLSSHIEILVPINLANELSNKDPFLNFQINDSELIKEECKTIVTKYIIISPRFLLITQKQKTDFWTSLTSDDSKVFCKQLQNYGIDKNYELSVMEMVQNSWYALPTCTKRGNFLEIILYLLVLSINIIIFFGYTVDST